MTGRADVLDVNLALRRLARQQHGVVSRAQLLACGVTVHAVADQLRARRWREPVPGVVVLHCGPIIRTARAWLAVLAAGDGAALCAWTALEVFGLTGWLRDSTHIVVRRGRHVPCVPGVVVHESRRHGPADVLRHLDLPIHDVARAAVDAGAWSPSARSACGLLAAVVQQGLTTPDRLFVALDAAGRVAHRKQMAIALTDIAGGSAALSEIDFGRLCARAGLPEPKRQQRRRDLRGRQRYLDAEWDLPGGRRLIVEIDGVHHAGVEQWYDDLLRQAEVADPVRDVVIRIPVAAIRHEPDRVVAILRRAFASMSATPLAVSACRW